MGVQTEIIQLLVDTNATDQSVDKKSWYSTHSLHERCIARVVQVRTPPPSAGLVRVEYVDIGLFWNAGTTSTEQCPANTYADKERPIKSATLASCRPCPLGTSTGGLLGGVTCGELAGQGRMPLFACLKFLREAQCEDLRHEMLCAASCLSAKSRRWCRLCHRWLL